MCVCVCVCVCEREYTCVFSKGRIQVKQRIECNQRTKCTPLIYFKIVPLRVKFKIFSLCSVTFGGVMAASRGIL